MFNEVADYNGLKLMLKEGLNTKYITKLFKYLMQPNERVIYATKFWSTRPGLYMRIKHSVKNIRTKSLGKTEQKNS